LRKRDALNLNLGDTRYIISKCNDAGLTAKQTAYVLATAYHETGHTMKPVTEMGGLAYLQSKPYYPYVGRGYVQLTWINNYRHAGSKLGVDFVRYPTKLLDKKYAAEILVRGMQEGWFTDKKLSDYINARKCNYTEARRIINGTDRASLIAEYAVQYYDALTNKKQTYAPHIAGIIGGILAALGISATTLHFSPLMVIIPVITLVIGLIVLKKLRGKK